MVFETYSEKETFELGKKLASTANSGDVFTLEGDLGCGKTVFSKGFAKGLGIEENISSPTFTIVSEYTSGKMPFYHFDVYRISDESEMDEIGFDDYIYGNGVCLIEWANIIKDILPQDVIEVSIEKDLEKGFDYRRITVVGGKE